MFGKMICFSLAVLLAISSVDVANAAQPCRKEQSTVNRLARKHESLLLKISRTQLQKDRALFKVDQSIARYTIQQGAYLYQCTFSFDERARQRACRKLNGVLQKIARLTAKRIDTAARYDNKIQDYVNQDIFVTEQLDAATIILHQCLASVG